MNKVGSGLFDLKRALEMEKTILFLYFVILVYIIITSWDTNCKTLLKRPLGVFMASFTMPPPPPTHTLLYGSLSTYLVLLCWLGRSALTADLSMHALVSSPVHLGLWSPASFSVFTGLLTVAYEWALAITPLKMKQPTYDAMSPSTLYHVLVLPFMANMLLLFLVP